MQSSITPTASVQTLPVEIAQWGELKTLNLRNNKLPPLPATISQLSNLTYVTRPKGEITQEMINQKSAFFGKLYGQCLFIEP